MDVVIFCATLGVVGVLSLHSTFTLLYNASQDKAAQQFSHQQSFHSETPLLQIVLHVTATLQK